MCYNPGVAIIEAAIAIPILLALFRGKKKGSKRGSSKSASSSDSNSASGSGSASGSDFQLPGDSALVPGENEGTWHVGGTGDPQERFLPESHRLILDSSCAKMAVRIRIWDYDKWITGRYWELRHAGWEDPEAMTVDILEMDSPHCQWPPGPGSSELQQHIWNWLYPGVRFFYEAEISGTLKDYKWEPMPSIVPLVVWAGG